MALEYDGSGKAHRITAAEAEPSDRPLSMTELVLVRTAIRDAYTWCAAETDCPNGGELLELLGLLERAQAMIEARMNAKGRHAVKHRSGESNESCARCPAAGKCVACGRQYP